MSGALRTRAHLDRVRPHDRENIRIGFAYSYYYSSSTFTRAATPAWSDGHSPSGVRVLGSAPNKAILCPSIMRRSMRDRILAYKEGAQVTLLSRNDKNRTESLRLKAETAQHWFREQLRSAATL
jgi:hypothetical protein